MKLIESDYNEETGISSVTLQNKWGMYTGTAKVHPEDINHTNKFFGCRIAELRAWIKYFKQELKKTKIQLRTVKNLQKDIQHFSYNNSKNIEQRIFIKIKEYSKRIEDLNASIQTIENEIKLSISFRDKMFDKDKNE